MLGILVAWFAPKFPEEVGVVVWLLYLAFIYAFSVFKFRRKWGNRMSLFTVLLIGWAFITFMSVVVWYGFKPNADLTVARTSTSPATPLTRPPCNPMRGLNYECHRELGFKLSMCKGLRRTARFPGGKPSLELILLTVTIAE